VIEKIIKLRGIGLLHDSLPSGALLLSKTAAIYSDNGRGKSTFSCLLRSLPGDDCDEVCARQTLGAGVRPHAEILIEGTKHTLSEGSWDKTHSRIRVFDDDFVERNVCSGMRIEPKHRENLLEFALGGEAASLKAEIDDLARQISEQNETIRTAKAVLEPQAAPYSLDEFVALPEEPPAAAEIASVDRALRDAENVSAIAARPLLLPIDIPIPDTAKQNELLAKSVEGIGSEAEELVREHIQTHLGDGGEQWLRQGAEYVKGDECPFCGQPVGGVALVKAFRAFFSEQYEALLTAVDSQKTELEQSFDDEQLDTVSLAIAKRAEVAAAWNDQDVAIPATPDGVVDACRRVKSELVRLIRLKSAAPLTALAVDDAAQKAMDDLALTRAAVTEFNRSVIDTNARLTAIQAGVASADVAALEADRARVKAREKRPTLSPQCASYVAARDDKKRLETEKTAKRSQLTQMTTDLLDEYCDAINVRLRAFGADFEVVKLARSDAGGTPRAIYALHLMGTEIPLAADSTSPSFSTTLSGGDRRLLALAFFLAILDTDPEPAGLSVVLDDPVCSFDIYRRAKLVEAIKAMVDRGTQLIVLSHDADFVKALRDSGFESILQLRRSGQHCVFDECDIDEVCESDYIGQYRELTHYLAVGRREEQLRDIAKRIRPYLETNLRHRFPVELKQTKNLGEILGAIKNRSTPSSLDCLAGEITDLVRVNDYASPYHHNEGPRPVDRELREIVELALALGRN
jgi:wobble nucleotide-excising tRNase